MSRLLILPSLPLLGLLWATPSPAQPAEVAGAEPEYIEDYPADYRPPSPHAPEAPQERLPKSDPISDYHPPAYPDAEPDYGLPQDAFLFEEEPSHHFLQGTWHLTGGMALIGMNSDRLDASLELSGGYLIYTNLELALAANLIFGTSPFRAGVGPALRLFIPINETFVPYLGAFYRHWFDTDERPDDDTAGARAGLLIKQANTRFYLGVAYESTLHTCLRDCYDIFPELGVSFTF